VRGLIQRKMSVLFYAIRWFYLLHVLFAIFSSYVICFSFILSLFYLHTPNTLLAICDFWGLCICSNVMNILLSAKSLSTARIETCGVGWYAM
jgi:hypothetical protein